MNASGGLAELGRFYDSTQAHIIRGKLEAEDIECMVFDDQHNSTAWHLGIALGGLRLMVLKEDLEAARNILKEEMQLYHEQTPKPKGFIKRPVLKTLLGSVVGFFVGAPSIPPSKKDDL